MALRSQHIYFTDPTRKTGYFYDPELNIFCLLDKHELLARYQAGGITVSVENITDRLRNYAKSEIPVGFHRMFDLYTGQYRERGPGDGATYFLDPPRENSTLPELLAHLTPTPEILRDFVFRALIEAAPYETLLLQGPGTDIFTCLDTLYPLTLSPKESFFRRPYLGSQLQGQVCGRKLLYGGIPPTSTYRRPRGLGSVPMCVVAEAISWSCQDKITPLVTRDYGGKLPYIHQAELLYWLAFPPSTSPKSHEPLRSEKIPGNDLQSQSNRRG